MEKASAGGIAEIVFCVQNGHNRPDEALVASLYQQIGQLNVELDWLKKTLNASAEERQRWINPNSKLSIVRQCELVGISRSTLYYQPVPETPLNLHLMRLIDDQYLKTPFLRLHNHRSGRARHLGRQTSHERNRSDSQRDSKGKLFHPVAFMHRLKQTWHTEMCLERKRIFSSTLKGNTGINSGVYAVFEASDIMM